MFRKLALATPLAAATLAAAVDAHTGVSDPQVKARMETMSQISDAMKVIGTMAKGAAEFDADAAEAALERVASLATQIPEDFEPKATDPVSEARPEIWEEWDSFTAQAEDLAETADALSITARDDLRPAIAELGGACRACHEDYRE
jgi:cytochrome c556